MYIVTNIWKHSYNSMSLHNFFPTSPPLKNFPDILWKKILKRFGSPSSIPQIHYESTYHILQRKLSLYPKVSNTTQVNFDNLSFINFCWTSPWFSQTYLLNTSCDKVPSIFSTYSEVLQMLHSLRLNQQHTSSHLIYHSLCIQWQHQPQV